MFENDTYSYKGWMTSDYFLKRAFGALLHQMAAVLIVYGILLVLAFVFIILAAVFAAFVFGMTNIGDTIFAATGDNGKGEHCGIYMLDLKKCSWYKNN